MQNKNSHPVTNADRLIDALLGFDRRELQRQMTDGLDEWCRRRNERASEARLYFRSMAVALLLMLPAYLLADTDTFCLSGGMTYLEAVTRTNALLCL